MTASLETSDYRLGQDFLSGWTLDQFVWQDRISLVEPDPHAN